MRSAIAALTAAALLAACDRRPATTERAPAAPNATAVRAASPSAAAPDTADLTRAALPRAVADTALRLNGQLCRLQLSATADSSRMLTAVTTGIVGEAFAADSAFARNKTVRGPEGTYRFTLTDAAGRRLFRRELHKADFYLLVGPDVAVVAEPELPVFLGYFPQLGGLAFQLSVGIPQSDVGDDLFLLLDLRGQVRNLSHSNLFGYGSADCDPRATPDGRALLTCAQLLRAGRPPRPLRRPQAELVLARFVNDSTLLTLYDYKQTRYTYAADSTLEAMSEEEPAAVRSVPNGFLTTVRGTELARFRFDGGANLLGYSVARRYVPQCHTYFLLDAERGLRLIDKRNPAATRAVSFQQMQPFRPPQRTGEVRFRLGDDFARFEFYADRNQPEKLRFRRLNEEN